MKFRSGGRESNLGTLYQVGPPEMNIQKVLVLYAIMCINELEANDSKDLLTTIINESKKETSADDVKKSIKAHSSRPL